MKLITAKVKGTPREVTTKYEQRSVMDVLLMSNGQTATIWGTSNCKDILNRANGERVQVALDSKGKYHVVEHGSSFTQTITSKEIEPEYNAHNGKSADIADYVERLAKLYNYCHKTAKLNVQDSELDHEDYRTIATTLFLAAKSKFDL
jgi:hypothetical protein